VQCGPCCTRLPACPPPTPHCTSLRCAVLPACRSCKTLRASPPLSLWPPAAPPPPCASAASPSASARHPTTSSRRPCRWEPPLSSHGPVRVGLLAWQDAAGSHTQSSRLSAIHKKRALPACPTAACPAAALPCRCPAPALNDCLPCLWPACPASALRPPSSWPCWASSTSTSSSRWAGLQDFLQGWCWHGRLHGQQGLRDGGARGLMRMTQGCAASGAFGAHAGLERCTGGCVNNVVPV
jgi:hypothetical protein